MSKRQFVINGMRGSGKTTELIKLAVKRDAVIAAIHPEYVNDMAAKLGVKVHVIRHRDVERYRGIRKDILIDEVETFLRNTVNPQVAGFTSAGELISLDLPDLGKFEITRKTKMSFWERIKFAFSNNMPYSIKQEEAGRGFGGRIN